MKLSRKARFNNVNGILRAEFDGMTVELRSFEELFILHEIFVRTCYGWCPSRPTLVVDVGSNVGLSCLYFAKLPNVEQVVGFEPFPRTLAEAERNLHLNLGLAKKIKLNPFGLGASRDRVPAEYSFIHKGRVSPVGGLARVKGPIPDKTVVMIDIRDAAAEMEELLTTRCGLEFALKLDCEGSEYDIVPRLAEVGILKKFRTVFIEWHGRGPGSLRTALADSNFNVFCLDEFDEVGLIYAAQRD